MITLISPTHTYMITLISLIHTYMITLIFNNRKSHSIGSIRLLILQ
jgi:hypothetical protein